MKAAIFIGIISEIAARIIFLIGISVSKMADTINHDRISGFCWKLIID